MNITIPEKLQGFRHMLNAEVIKKKQNKTTFLDLMKCTHRIRKFLFLSEFTC